MRNYDYAREKYLSIGIDPETAMASLMEVPISLHCWQGDDVKGFDILTVDCPPGYFEYEYELDEPPTMLNESKEEQWTN